MRKILRSIYNLVFIIIIIGLTVYIIGMQFFAEQLQDLIGFRTFVILTDSMEPTIPVGSLVLDKNIKEGQEIPENAIISFRVNRLGEDVVFTHYYKTKEVDESGKERYYTQAENADRYDDYITYREDILGIYITHVPYVGKFILFLQSPFALLEIGIILIIMIIYSILANKFDEEEKAKLTLQEEDTGPDFQNNEESLIIEAENSDGEVHHLQLMQENAVESEEEVTVPDAVPEAETEQLPASTEAAGETVPEVEPVPEEKVYGDFGLSVSTQEPEHEDAVSEEESLPDTGPDTESVELPVGQEAARPAKNVFSYCMNRPDSNGEQSAAGFSIEIFRDGTIWHKINSLDGQETEILTYSIGKKEAKKIRKMIKDNDSAIRKLPKVLDNNSSEGNFNTFSFMGQVITGRNVQVHDLKKEKKQNLYYYRKYKQSMKYENEVMYLFKQIGKILKEEGIKLKLDGVVVKKK